jgi:hypothetical protein
VDRKALEIAKEMLNQEEKKSHPKHNFKQDPENLDGTTNVSKVQNVSELDPV